MGYFWNGYNPDIQHRRSIRLKWYDYTKEGQYFITICTQDRECLFGDIQNGEMQLSSVGKIVQKWWFEMEKKFPNIHLPIFVVMPNHIHGIIEIHVGADLCVRPDNSNSVRPDNSNSVRPDSQMESLQSIPGSIFSPSLTTGSTESITGSTGSITGSTHRSTPMTDNWKIPISRMIQWFKTMSTNECISMVKNQIWNPFNKKIWQRNYYEHIIWNEEELKIITEYIRKNPENWENDKLFLKFFFCEL